MTGDGSTDSKWVFLAGAFSAVTAFLRLPGVVGLDVTSNPAGDSKLARWVGAGGNGMKQGLLEMKVQKRWGKQKAAWRPRRLCVWKLSN
jgi:hypothetical protein